MARRARKPLAPPRVLTAFWDTSALVPLCVTQSFTVRASQLYETYQMVIWWATPVELASALARLMRTQYLSVADWKAANALAARLGDEWSTVQPSRALQSAALSLVERFDLRAADALQLAAALEWCEGNPSGRTVLAADQKLREAALMLGFNSPPILPH